MRRLLSALFLSLLPVASIAGSPVVVELFTSQGCSSCPPADVYLSELGEREDVIALAFHVTYWDRLGWKDTFATREGTQRQYSYGNSFGNRSVWTPQFVVNGQEYSRDRFREMVDGYVRDAQGDTPVDLTATVEGGRLTVATEARTGGLGQMEVFVAHVLPQETVKVARGENGGKTLRYTHVVKDFYPVGRWNGRGKAETTVDLKGAGPLVVFVQEKGHGAIVAATRVE